MAGGTIGQSAAFASFSTAIALAREMQRGVGVIFGVVVCCVSAYIALALRDEEAVGSFGLIWLFPLTFVSAAFVQVSSMPGWLQAFAKNQPVTIVIEEMRSLALGGPHVLHAWQSALWLAATVAVFVPLSVRAYRRG